MNHREKKRKLVITTLSVIAVAVLSLTIAYAALSEMLTISGTGTVNAIDWDISIKNSTGNKTTGGATYTTPVVNGTTITYSVNLTRPGDSVTLYFDVENNGDINGEISSIINSTPVCTSSTGNEQDASLICDNLEVTIKYSTGTSISAGDIINTENTTCYSGRNYGYYETTLMVTVKLKDSMTSVPTSSVNLTNMKHDIIYSQSNKTCSTQTACFVAGTKVLTENGYKSIEKIQPGEFVYAMNEENNTYELKEVLQKFESLTSEIYEIKVADHLIRTTARHEFYIVDKGWIRAKDLKAGDKLSSKEEIDTTITSIEIKPQKERVPVYNMEVEGHHNYLITEDNLLVHNAGTK